MGDVEANSRALPKIPPFELFVVPSKATKEAEWTTQLKSYIVELGEDPASYASEIGTFHRMRQDARGAPGTGVGIDLLCNYYRQLDSLSKRLPLVEHPLTMSFTWHDAFDPACSVRQSSVAFEKANVLFNLGAILSQAGAAVAATSGEGPRLLQAAASVFTFVADNFLHPPLADITRPTLLFLTAVMLAQAQETVVIRALAEGKSAATLSRLAAAAARLAGEARRLLAGPELADLRSCFLSGGSLEGDRDPISLIQTKALVWEALAEYLRGEAAYRETQVGEAIARVRQTEERLATVSGGYDEGSRLMTFVRSTLSPLVKARRTAWEKENGLIYTQSVPDANALSTLEGISLVKVAPLADVLKTVSERPDLFKKLLPLRVHEEISKYSEEKSKLLRYETLKVSTADGELQATLTALGFPAALETLEGGTTTDSTGLPEEFVLLRRKAAAQEAESTRGEVEQSLERASHMETRITDDLDEEISAYQRARVEHGAAWTQSPSHLGNTVLFEELARLQAVHKELASHHNQLLSSALTVEEQSDYELLTGAEGRLLGLLPRPDNFIDDGRIECVHKVRTILDDLERLARERATSLALLRDALLADDISDALAVTRSGADTTTLFHQELAKFDESCQLVEDNVVSHQALLSQFRELWQEVVVLGRSKESDQLRRDLRERLAAAVAARARLHESLRSLREDVQGRLIGPLTALADRVDQFVRQRGRERQELAHSMQLAGAQRGQEYLLEKLKKLSVKTATGTGAGTGTGGMTRRVSDVKNLPDRTEVSASKTDLGGAPLTVAAPKTEANVGGLQHPSTVPREGTRVANRDQSQQHQGLASQPRQQATISATQSRQSHSNKTSPPKPPAASKYRPDGPSLLD